MSITARKDMVVTMTQNEKELIGYYQRKGYGYKKIAQLVNIPSDNIKYYCRKNPAEGLSDICLGCGSPIHQTPHHKQKVFCSDVCRMKWWNRHPEIVARKFQEHICPHCGKTYLTSRSGQRFCSRQCVGASRRKAVPADE